MSTNLFDLAAKISVDTAGSDRALTANQQKVLALAKQYEHLDKSATKSLKSVTGESQFAQNQAALLSRSVAQLTARMSGAGQGASVLASGLTMAGGAATGFALALGLNVVGVVKLHMALADLAIDTAKHDAELVNKSRQLAVSIETVQAAQILAAQSGRSLNQVIEDSNGNLDSAIERFRKLGIIVGSEDVEAGKRLNDQIVILGFQFEALENQIGRAITPQAAAIMDNLTRAMRENKDMVDDLVGGIAMLANYLGGNLVVAISGASFALGSFRAQMAPLIAAIQFINGIGGQTGNISGSFLGAQAGVGGNGPLRMGVDFSEINIGGFTGKGKGSRGGGRGGGGGSQADAGIALLKQLQQEFFRLTEHTKLETVQEQLLEKQFAKTSDQIKRRTMVVATEIDVTEKVLSLTRERYATEASLMRLQEEAFIKSLTRARVLAEIERQRFATRAGQNRPSWIDLGGGSTVGGEPATTGRERHATLEGQVMEQQIARFNDRMRDLAYGLTNTIDRALTDGFERGMKAGLISFAQGILDMIRSAALNALEKRLFDILSGAGSSGGGGGWLGKLLGIGLGAIGGAVGGGSGGNAGYVPGRIPFLPKLAGGMPYVPYDNFPALLHKGERVVPASQNNGSGHTFIINVTAQDARGVEKSAREIRRQVMGGMRDVEMRNGRAW